MFVYIKPSQGYLLCLVCGGASFARREIKMTTTGMTFMDLDWLNKSADGAICTSCAFVHTFMGDNHQWVDPESLDRDQHPSGRVTPQDPM